MKNLQIARIFYDIADMLELDGIQFKPEAYRRAARNIESMSQDLEEVWKEGKLDSLPGIGKSMAQKIAEYLQEGRLQYYEKLKSRVPPGLVEITRISGVGPKTAKLLYDTLHIETVEQLREAAAKGKIEGLRGLGRKKVENILRGIELLAESKKRMLLGQALPLAERTVEYLRTHAPVQRITVAGSLRRMRETVGDIDILVTAEDWRRVMDAFTGMPYVKEVLLHGDTKSSVILEEGIQTDLRVLNEDSFGSALQYFTGSKDHNIQLRNLAIDKGLKLSEYGVFRGDEKIAGATEEEVYAALGLSYIEPELREAQGEVERSREGRLPRLIKTEDIKGDLHVHTNWTDGHGSLRDMVEAAKARGYEYVGISDHSGSLYIAGGMKEDDILRQMEEVRALREQMKGIHVLHGAEVDIKDHGELDFSEDVLRELDYVIAAVHSKLKMTEAEMTERVLTAMENEQVDILAHPTCRLINERAPVALDMPKVIESAVETDTALEINSYITRLDLNGGYAKAAKEEGAKLVINTDSHTSLHLDLMKFGIGQARRGWVEPSDVINTMPYEKLLSWLHS
ncbi:MAG: DNA polymerase/3'-5' exonuclease PolX [Thermoplasmata archaeon]